MTGMEWQDRLAEQFGCLLERWTRIETRNRNVFVPSYANILPNILDLVLDTKLKRKNSVQWDCEELADDERRIAVRIRANASYPDARKTLERYGKQRLTGAYNNMVMLVMATSLRRLREMLRETYFSPERDLWSLEDLYYRIRELEDIQKGEKICGYLDQLLAVPFEEPRNLLRFAPRHTDAFVGREQELITLRNKLAEKKPIFITGIGGIGKTEVALKMAHLFAPPKGAYLIRCNSSIDEEKEIIRQVILNADFSGYSPPRTDCDDHDLDYDARMKILREQYRDAMLIIDNLDLQKKSVQDIQSEKSYRMLAESGVYLIFTTRHATDGVEINRMDKAVLKELVKRYYPCPNVTDDQLGELIDAVDGHTLMVILMVQSISRSWGRVKPENFLKTFREKQLDSRQYPTVKMDRNGEFSSRNIYDYLSVVFQMSDISAMDRTILLYAALLPDEGFYEPLFQEALAACTQMGDEPFMRIEENVDSIVARSWLKKENGMLMIHPVIRNVCLRELKPTDENCRDFLDALWQLRYEQKLYDAKTNRQLANLFQMATNKLEDRERIWCLRAGVFWGLLGNMGQALECCKKVEQHINRLSWNQLGEMDHPMECCRKTVERQSNSTDSTVALVQYYNKIGAAYLAVDRIKEARESFLCAKRIAEENPELDPYCRAMTLNNLGSVYSDLGDYNNALTYREEALKILEEIYPKRHPALAVAYSNIGSVYAARGDYKTSLSYNLKALDIREERSASDLEDDLDLAKTYNNVGGNYFRLRDYMKAQDYLLKALMIRERLLPDGHPDLVRSYNNMGGLYIRMGDDKIALEYLQKALKLRSQVPLDEYLGLATIHNNMAGLYTKLGDFERGLDNLLEALSLQEKIDPPDRPDIAQTHSNIAWTHYGMGHYQKAEEHIRKAIMIAEEVLPADHTDLDMYRRAELRFLEKRRICEGAG